MSIRVTCPGCGVSLTFGPDRAGSHVNCPKCNSPVHVPPTRPSPPPLPPAPSPLPLPDESPPVPRGKRRPPARRANNLTIPVIITAVVFAIALGTALVLWLAWSPSRPPREMRHSSLNELLVDLHSKPDVVGVVPADFGYAHLIETHLPPDRKHAETSLLIYFRGDSEPLNIWVVDCGSADRANLLAVLSAIL